MFDLRENYSEIFAFSLFFFSFSYFCITVKNYISKKPEIQQIKLIQEPIKNYEYTTTGFEQMLKQNGFKQFKVFYKNDELVAMTEKNTQNLGYLIKNYKIKSIENSQTLLLKWQNQNTPEKPVQDAPKKIIIQSFWFISKNNWAVQIEGNKYGPENMQISNEIKIIQANEDFIVILEKDKTKKVYI